MQEDLLHVLAEEARRAHRAGLAAAFGYRDMQAERFGLIGRGLRRGEPVVGLGHPGQHGIAPLEGRRGMQDGIVGRRVLHDAGQGGGLGYRQLRRAGAEVRLGGGLDPVGEIAEVGVVQVSGHDVLLGLLVLGGHRHPQLVQLAAQRIRGRGLHALGVVRLLGLEQEHVLHVLLRDRGTALDRFVLDIVHRRADRAAQVDGAVLPVPGVLDAHHRVHHVRRDLAVADWLPVPAEVLQRARAVGAVVVRHIDAVHPGEEVAVPVQDLRPLGQALGAQRHGGELVSLVPDQDPGHGHHGYHHGGGEYPGDRCEGDEASEYARPGENRLSELHAT